MAIPTFLAIANGTSLNQSLTNYSEYGDTNGSAGTEPDYAEYWRFYYLQRTLIIVLYSVTMVLGTIGNSVVVYTIWRCRHLHTVMYTLLASLSVCDLIVLVLVMPWRLRIHLYNDSWIFGDFMCRFPTYLAIFSGFSTVLHMTAISMERCYAVRFPLKSRAVLTMGNAYKLTAFLWIVSLIAAIPSLFNTAVKPYMNGLLCANNWPSVTALRIYGMYLFLFLFAIPMLLISIAYAFIVMALRKRRTLSEGVKNGNGGSSMVMNASRRYQVGSKNGTSSASGSGAEASRSGRGTSIGGSVHFDNGTKKLNKMSAKAKDAEIKQVTIMLVLVVVLFAVCWGPILTLSVLGKFGLYVSDDHYDRLMDALLYMLTFVNSAVNPFVYALVAVSFRQSCVWAIKVCCKSRKIRRRPSGASRATAISRTGISGGGSGGGGGGGGSTVLDNVSVSSSCAADKIPH